MSHQISRVLLVDSQRAFAELFAEKLDSQDDFEVVGIVNDGEAAMTRLAHIHSDLVVIDVNLEGLSAFEVAKEAVTRNWNRNVVFLTSNTTDIIVEQATRVRTSGYLTKAEPVDVIVAGLQRVVGGGTSYSREIAEKIQAFSSNDQPKTNSLSVLTPRQIEVLQNLAVGDSVKEVAKNMNLSEKSVDSHKYRIMRRLDIHDRVKLTLFAIREGLISP
jgi:DNA-binding NarL/FixJ family response regulator